MHIDASKPINKDYFDKLDSDIVEKCTAFARQVSRLNDDSVLGKKYLLETGQANPFWKHLGGFKYSPCVKTLAHCGIVFRGDSREPEVIFKEGFKSRCHPDIQSDNDFF